MREYLFRGKRLDNGEWIEGSLIIYDWDNNYVSIYSNEEEMAFQVDPETVGQWTGSRDNDGNRVYEDDILEYKSPLKSGGVVTSRTIVIWSSYKWSDKEIYSSRWSSEFNLYGWESPFSPGIVSKYGRVIGNIHDNPELLEGVEE